MKIDLELVSGFIEAGKTAFINSLLDLTKVKNDFTLLIITERGNSKIKDFSNNKVLFYDDDLLLMSKKVIDSINKYKPTRIIIEYNGTYTIDEFFYSLYLNGLDQYCTLKTIYYILNGEQFLYYFKNMSDLFIPYIENSNLILINNCQKLSEDKKAEIYNLLASLNYNSHILFSGNNEKILTSLKESNLFLNNKYRKIKLSLRNKLNEYVKKMVN